MISSRIASNLQAETLGKIVYEVGKTVRACKLLQWSCYCRCLSSFHATYFAQYTKDNAPCCCIQKASSSCWHVSVTRSLLFILLGRTKPSLALRPFRQLSDEITPEHVIVKSTWRPWDSQAGHRSQKISKTSSYFRCSNWLYRVAPSRLTHFKWS